MEIEFIVFRYEGGSDFSQPANLVFTLNLNSWQVHSLLCIIVCGISKSWKKSREPQNIVYFIAQFGKIF